MYNPVAFRELRPEIIEEAMGAQPLATLVTIGTQGLIASHLPLLYYRAEGVSPDDVLPDGVLPDGVLGFLRGHLARANSQWQDSLPSSEALAIFNGPQHYVSPTWYPSTSEHGKVVPTWNYVTVHAHGTVSFKTDADR